MKKSKQPVEKRFSFKDIIIIILSLLALAGLVFVMKMTNEEEKKKQEELGNISSEIQNSGTGTIVGGSSSTAGVMINEVNQEGWLELFYTGKTSYALDGLQVYLAGNKVYEVDKEWRLMAGEYGVLDLGVPLGTTEGEVLELRKADGEPVEYLRLPSLADGESYGASNDGDIDKVFMESTKGATNLEAVVRAKTQLLFSVPGGFYENEFLLKLTAPEGYTVYYTTDGTEPGLESKKYEAPIRIQNRSGGNYTYATGMQENFYTPNSIDMGTVVRAVMVDASGKIVEEKVASYYVGFVHDSDYENLPVLSIVTNPENLFDYFEGIYVKGRSYEDALAAGSIEQAANYFNGWSKPAYIEFFEPNKDKSFEADVNIRIAWDVSIANSQKSFQIKSTNVDSLLPGATVSKYFSKQSNTLQVTTGYYDNTYKLRELTAQNLLSDYTNAMLELTPCIVFVDGEYWGVYLLQENFDESYLKATYNTGESRMMFRRNGILQEPEEKESYRALKNSIIMNDLSVTANYEAVKKQLDIQSYIDNLCINMYLANSEYGNYNSWWRSWGVAEQENCDGRWRLVLPRFDNSMYNGATGGKTTYSINSFLMPAVTQDAIFQSLMMNPEFRNLLLTTMQKLADEVFSMDKVDNALKEVNRLMKKASLSSFKRFHGNITSEYYEAEAAKIQGFFEQRAEYILFYTEELVAKGGDKEVIELARQAILEEQLQEELELQEQSMLPEETEGNVQTE